MVKKVIKKKPAGKATPIQKTSDAEVLDLTKSEDTVKARKTILKKGKKVKTDVKKENLPKSAKKSDTKPIQAQKSPSKVVKEDAKKVKKPVVQKPASDDSESEDVDIDSDKDLPDLDESQGEGEEQAFDKTKAPKKPTAVNEQKEKPKPKTEREIKEMAERTVFVGNVNPKTPRKKIQQLFKPYGNIEAVYSRSTLNKTEKHTKKALGANKLIRKGRIVYNVYLRFSTVAEAQSACVLNGTVLQEHTLRVAMSLQKQVDSSRSIFVGNIKKTATEQELYDFFKEHSVAPESTRIMHDYATGESKGVGFVTFKDSSSIPLAFNLDGTKFKGWPIRISKVAKKKDRIVATNTSTNKKAAERRISQENNTLKQKLANYIVTKKTFAQADKSKRLPKKIQKVIRQKKTAKKSLLS